jgi:hypothetical protein
MFFEKKRPLASKLRPKFSPNLANFAQNVAPVLASWAKKLPNEVG